MKKRFDNETLDNAISVYKIATGAMGDDFLSVLDQVTLAFLEELKEYRNLEEQGLLLKLPVTVGSSVFEIIEDEFPKPHIYIAE